jgi:hypothetical protein
LGKVKDDGLRISQNVMRTKRCRVVRALVSAVI